MSEGQDKGNHVSEMVCLWYDGGRGRVRVVVVVMENVVGQVRM